MSGRGAGGCRSSRRRRLHRWYQRCRGRCFTPPSCAPPAASYWRLLPKVEALAGALAEYCGPDGKPSGKAMFTQLITADEPGQGEGAWALYYQNRPTGAPGGTGAGGRGALACAAGQWLAGADSMRAQGAFW